MNERPLTIYEIWRSKGPQAALDETFRRYEERTGWKDRAFMFQRLLGTNGVSYGSYREVTRAELTKRAHKIEMSDYAVSVYWLDALHDHRTHKNVPRGEVK